jgi:hypothetical protein
MEVLPSAAIEWSEETWWTVTGRRRHRARIQSTTRGGELVGLGWIDSGEASNCQKLGRMEVLPSAAIKWSEGTLGKDSVGGEGTGACGMETDRDSGERVANAGPRRHAMLLDVCSSRLLQVEDIMR